jgi:hypothetical protein
MQIFLFENRVLRQTHQSEMDEVTQSWKKLHTEQLRELFSSLNIVKVNKSRRHTKFG